MSDLDMETIRSALKTAQQYGFYEVSLSEGETRFKSFVSPATSTGKMKRDRMLTPSKAETAAVDDLAIISSSFVGYLQLVHEKLEVGKTLQKGDVIAHVFALGLPNEVVSEVEGEIVEIFASDMDCLEYKQPIASVRLG